MVWFRVDDTLPFHERIIRAGNAAVGLWVRAGAWSSGQLTDGLIPAEVARTMGTPSEIRRLVDVGLWIAEGDGYRFHAWAEDGTGAKRQPTRAEVEAQRRSERERKAAYRDAHRDKPRTPPPAPSTVPTGVPAGHPADVRPESRQASGYPDPTRPDPYKEARSLTGSRSSDGPADAVPSEPSESTEVALIEAPKPPARTAYGPTFERFWEAYPRHEGKRAASAAFERAVKRATASEIIAAARRYAEDRNREDAYTAHPTTWLNRDGWHDAPLPQRRPTSQHDRLRDDAQRTLEALERMGA